MHLRKQILYDTLFKVQVLFQSLYCLIQWLVISCLILQLMTSNVHLVSEAPHPHPTPHVFTLRLVIGTIQLVKYMNSQPLHPFIQIILVTL